MWVLSECDGAGKAVLLDLLECVFGEGGCVAESDIGLVWGRAGVEGVEKLARFGGLVLGPFSDRRAAADDGVLVLDFGSAAAGN